MSHELRGLTLALAPGAGVDPEKVCRPSKRVKGWHLVHRMAFGVGYAMSLKAYIRKMASYGPDEHREIAKRWMKSKGMRR